MFSIKDDYFAAFECKKKIKEVKKIVKFKELKEIIKYNTFFSFILKR